MSDKIELIFLRRKIEKLESELRKIKSERNQSLDIENLPESLKKQAG